MVKRMVEGRSMITDLGHIAVVVEDLERALHVFEEVLGLPVAKVQELPEQRAKAAFLSLGQSQIELLEPTDDSSGVARFLASRGEGLHHICLEVDDIDSTLSELKEKGLRLINETAVEGAHGRVAFIHPKATHGLMIELLERRE
jgi:methylmalonyl-CoA/ethylmalonyl-CoA epimerase